MHLQIKFVRNASISTYLHCPICYNIYQHPKRVYCGHTFCEKCLQSIIKSLKPNCPLCRKEIDIACVGVDLIAQNIIGSQEVFCPYELCPWKGKLKKLQNHFTFQCLMKLQQSKNNFYQNIKENKDDEVQQKVNENIEKVSLIARILNKNRQFMNLKVFQIQEKNKKQKNNKNIQQVQYNQKTEKNKIKIRSQALKDRQRIDVTTKMFQHYLNN